MARTDSFTFSALPKNTEELHALPEADLSTPFKAAALTVLALIRYTESPNDGIAMLNSLRGPRELSEYEKQFLRDRLRGKEYVAMSYLGGTNPDNEYTPAAPYTISVSDNPYSYTEDGYAKLHLVSSGADSPRPVTLRQKDDKWLLWEQMLLADIRKPKSQADW